MFYLAMVLGLRRRPQTPADARRHHRHRDYLAVWLAKIKKTAARRHYCRRDRHRHRFPPLHHLWEAPALLRKGSHWQGSGAARVPMWHRLRNPSLLCLAAEREQIRTSVLLPSMSCERRCQRLKNELRYLKNKQKG